MLWHKAREFHGSACERKEHYPSHKAARKVAKKMKGKSETYNCVCGAGVCIARKRSENKGNYIVNSLGDE